MTILQLIEKYSDNPQALKVIRLIFDTKKSLFLTGRAGSGKSTLINHITKILGDKCVVVAPTGIAALNAEGATIHKTFGFKYGILNTENTDFTESQQSVFEKVELIIIDEISMCRADILTAISDKLCYNLGDFNKPFAGKRILMVGDLFQLPPVVTDNEREYIKTNYKSPYFFDANIENFSFSIIELTKNYRQNDTIFVNILNNVREGNHTGDCLKVLNGRLNYRFEQTLNSGYNMLVPTNKQADSINEKMYNECNGKAITYYAKITGDFIHNTQSKINVDVELKLKEGLQVVFMVNERGGSRYFNGTMGEIVSLFDDKIVVLINGIEHEILPHLWESVEYRSSSAGIIRHVIGSFMQYPIRLGYAITIHKSQGQTYDKVVIDMGNGAFAHGQSYVALSRCKTLEGIVLKTPIRSKDIIIDSKIVDFMKKNET
jgi:ATP-dependent DNA helicase PIF1